MPHARKGRNTGSHWSKPVAAPLHSTSCIGLSFRSNSCLVCLFVHCVPYPCSRSASIPTIVVASMPPCLTSNCRLERSNEGASASFRRKANQQTHLFPSGAGFPRVWRVPHAFRPAARAKMRPNRWCGRQRCLPIERDAHAEGRDSLVVLQQALAVAGEVLGKRVNSQAVAGNPQQRVA